MFLIYLNEIKRVFETAPARRAEHWMTQCPQVLAEDADYISWTLPGPNAWYHLF